MNREDVIRLAREEGIIDFRDADDDPHVVQMVEALQRVVSRAVAEVMVRGLSTPVVVKTADLDPAVLRDMLAKAPPMQLRPIPPDAALEAERAARIAAQTEAVELKERLARSGVEERRAVAAEREACAGLMASLRAKSRNHLFRSALAIAEGEIRARGTA